jgi:hypothetical protein
MERRRKAELDAKGPRSEDRLALTLDTLVKPPESVAPPEPKKRGLHASASATRLGRSGAQQKSTHPLTSSASHASLGGVGTKNSPFNSPIRPGSAGDGDDAMASPGSRKKSVTRQDIDPNQSVRDCVVSAQHMPPLSINSHAILKFVLGYAVWPFPNPTHAQLACLLDDSLALFLALFWHIFTKYFQYHSSDVSQKYLNLVVEFFARFKGCAAPLPVGLTPPGMQAIRFFDQFLQPYSFVMSSGIFCALTRLFPASHALLTPVMATQIDCDVFQLLGGYDAAPVSLKRFRECVFPEEIPAVAVAALKSSYLLLKEVDRQSLFADRVTAETPITALDVASPTAVSPSASSTSLIHPSLLLFPDGSRGSSAAGRRSATPSASLAPLPPQSAPTPASSAFTFASPTAARSMHSAPPPAGHAAGPATDWPSPSSASATPATPAVATPSNAAGRTGLRRSNSIGGVESATQVVFGEAPLPELPIEDALYRSQRKPLRPRPVATQVDAKRLGPLTTGFLLAMGPLPGAQTNMVKRSQQDNPCVFGGAAYLPRFLSPAEQKHYEVLCHDVEELRQKTNRVEYLRKLKLVRRS